MRDLQVQSEMKFKLQTTEDERDFNIASSKLFSLLRVQREYLIARFSLSSFPQERFLGGAQSQSIPGSSHLISANPTYQARQILAHSDGAREQSEAALTTVVCTDLNASAKCLCNVYDTIAIQATANNREGVSFF